VATLTVKATPRAVKFFKEKLTGGKIYLNGMYVSKLGNVLSYQNVLFDKTVYKTTIAPGAHEIKVERGVLGGYTQETFSVQGTEKITAEIRITSFLRRLVIRIW